MLYVQEGAPMSNQPTPSEPTNQLIDLATQVANGEAPADDYRELLQVRIHQSMQNRQAFEERARARGDKFLEQHGGLAEQVLDLMEAYEAGLLRQADFFESGKPEALLEGNDLIAEAIGPLLEALDQYSGAYLDFGPSVYPLMNNVLITLRHLAEGTGDPKSLEDIKRVGIEYHRRAIAEVEASDKADSESFQAQKKAFEDIIRALEELRPIDNIGQMDSVVRPLQLALEARTAADEKIFVEHTALKPTNMPAANVLINVARGVLEDLFGIDQFRDTLHWYKSFTEQLEEQFDMAVEVETNSLVILEELPKTREVIDEHHDALSEFEDALTDFTRDNVEPILEEFIDVVERLEASSKVYQEAAEREGKLICLQCGHANQPSSRTCESCSVKLPQLVDPNMFSQSTFELAEATSPDALETDDYHMGVNTYRLFEAAYNFYEGNIDEPTFRDEIERSRKTLVSSEDGVASLTAREITDTQESMMTPEQLQTFRESQEMFMETKHLLEEGLDEWHEGLDHFEDYIDTRHRPTLETGIHLIFVASVKIDKVQRLGEMADKTLAELEDQEREEASGADSDGDDESPEE